MVYWEDREPGWLDWIWVTKPLLQSLAKPASRGKAAVGVGGGGEVQRGGKAGHGNGAAGGVHRDAVPLAIVVSAKKAGVDQRVLAALGGVDDAQAGVSRAGQLALEGVGGHRESRKEVVMPAT